MRLNTPQHSPTDQGEKAPEPEPAAVRVAASASIRPVAGVVGAAQPSEELLASFTSDCSPLVDLAHRMVAISKSHEGDTDGMGYSVDHVRPGKGFSSHEYSHKEMPNGRRVDLTTFYPGPFDAAAGLPNEISEKFHVWVGWGREGSESELPPLDLPEGAKWDCLSFDGPVNWYAEFEDGEKAEAYAASLPGLPADEYVAPFAEPRLRVVTDFGHLLRLAAAMGNAERAFNEAQTTERKEAYECAKEAHDAFHALCLKADAMQTGFSTGALN